MKNSSDTGKVAASHPYYGRIHVCKGAQLQPGNLNYLRRSSPWHMHHSLIGESEKTVLHLRLPPEDFLTGGQSNCANKVGLTASFRKLSFSSKFDSQSLYENFQ